MGGSEGRSLGQSEFHRISACMFPVIYSKKPAKA